MIYTCEFCKAPFSTADECEAHEQLHRENKDVWRIVLDPSMDAPADILMMFPGFRYSGSLDVVHKSDGEYWCHCTRGSRRLAVARLLKAFQEDMNKDMTEIHRKDQAVLQATAAAIEALEEDESEEERPEQEQASNTEKDTGNEVHM